MYKRVPRYDDALIIYNLIRSPNKRVFEVKIDNVGSAEHIKFMKDTCDRIRNFNVQKNP